MVKIIELAIGCFIEENGLTAVGELIDIIGTELRAYAESENANPRYRDELIAQADEIDSLQLRTKW